MKIEHLQQMVELAKTGSMNKAASNLFISQPNLSTSIRKLEEEMGIALILRSNRGITLTQQGEQFVDYAKSVLHQFERLKDICGCFENTEVPAFSIAMMRYRYVLHAVSQLYRKQNGPLNLSVHEMDRDSVLEAVARGNDELGVIGMLSCYRGDILKQIKSRELQYTRLAAYPCSVIVGRGNPLYKLPKDTELSVQALEEFPQVRYDKMDFGHFSDSREKLGIMKPPCEFVVSSRAAMFELLDTTDAYAIAATNHLAYEKTEYYYQAKSFPLSEVKLQSEVGWVRRAGRSLSPMAEEFISILDGYFK